MIRYSTDILQRLLLALDTQAWSCNENEGFSIFYERKPIGTGVAGGMRGGASTGDLWVHPEFNTIADHIRRVIFAEQECIDVS